MIVQPGAFTGGTEHFARARSPADVAVVEQYGDLPRLAEELGGRLDAIDAATGGALGVSAVGEDQPGSSGGGVAPRAGRRATPGFGRFTPSPPGRGLGSNGT